MHLFLQFPHRLLTLTTSNTFHFNNISESQPPTPTFNTNVPSYLQDQAIVKRSRKQLLPKYTETDKPLLQFDKPNIPSQFAAIAVQNLKRPLTPCKKATS
ncbi:hypothetical protein TNCV_3408421 [Trichonephila clavipes]|nr:hypothetical protein TNCV_3408421 [Trichonephila clavipes]